jgi:uncharacterized protein DUF3107
MDVIFGVQARDGVIRAHIDDGEIDAFKKRIEEAFKSAANEILWVTDKDGREVGIATDKIAFVEFGDQKSSRHVGFSN